MYLTIAPDTPDMINQKILNLVIQWIHVSTIDISTRPIVLRNLNTPIVVFQNGPRGYWLPPTLNCYRKWPNNCDQNSKIPARKYCTGFCAGLTHIT